MLLEGSQITDTPSVEYFEDSPKMSRTGRQDSTITETTIVIVEVETSVVVTTNTQQSMVTATETDPIVVVETAPTSTNVIIEMVMETSTTTPLVRVTSATALCGDSFSSINSAVCTASVGFSLNPDNLLFIGSFLFIALFIGTLIFLPIINSIPAFGFVQDLANGVGLFNRRSLNVSRKDESDTIPMHEALRIKLEKIYDSIAKKQRQN